MKQWKRHIIQAISTVLHNPFIPNFFAGKIYKGDIKHACLPGLNCYSCPGAAGACPIGSLQSVIGNRIKSIPYYVVGIILLFGILFGRLICGFLCPFGFFQDLLHKIPVPKIKIPKQVDKVLRMIKYIMLISVIILPLIIVDPYGNGVAFFCKHICPVGALEGGIPLALASEPVRGAIGALYSWKIGILIFIILVSIFLYRPFCKYFCPLGAIYGLLNRFSFYRMRVDEQACTHCGKCESACKMNVKITKNINSAECIRCGLCKNICPAGAIKSGLTETGVKFLKKHRK